MCKSTETKEKGNVHTGESPVTPTWLRHASVVGDAFPDLVNKIQNFMTTEVKTIIPMLLSELKATDPRRIAFDLQAVRAMAQHSPCWSMIELSDKERIGREFERIHLLLQELAVNPEI